MKGERFQGTGMAATVAEFAASQPQLFALALEASGLRACFGRNSVNVLHGKRVVAHFFPADDISYVVDHDALTRLFDEIAQLLEGLERGALADDESGGLS